MSLKLIGCGHLQGQDPTFHGHNMIFSLSPQTAEPNPLPTILAWQPSELDDVAGVLRQSDMTTKPKQHGHTGSSRKHSGGLFIGKKNEISGLVKVSF